MIVDLTPSELGDIEWGLGAAHGLLMEDIRKKAIQHDMPEKEARRLLRSLGELSNLFQLLSHRANLSEADNRQELQRIIEHELKSKTT